MKDRLYAFIFVLLCVFFTADLYARNGPGGPIGRPYPEKFTRGVDAVEVDGGDTTPDITNGGTKIHHRWAIPSGATPTVITQFDDGSGVTEFSDGDWFALDLDNGNYTIDFTSAYIEGNKGVALVGDSSNPVTLFFEFVGGATKFRCTNFNHGVSGVSVYSGVSNVAYGAGWDNDQTHSPTMDGVYDEVETKQDIVTEGSLPNLITSNDVKNGELVNADVSPTAAIDIDKTSWIEAGVTNVVSGGTNAVEWHPEAGCFHKYRLTGTLSDPVVLLISETDQLGVSFNDGDVLVLENVGTPQIQIGDISGQQAISGVTYYGNQDNTLCLIYSTNQWVEFARSSDTISADTINAKQKTFSFSGRTGTNQYSSISGVTVTMTDAEACGYGMHDSGTSGYYELPDPDPGSGNAGELGQLVIGVAGQDVTVTDASGASPFVNGTATIAATGAVITTSTVGEYFIWSPAYVAEYGWRWCIRIQDD